MTTTTRGILFDFDGVIVNSLPVHFAAWQEALREVFGVPVDDVAAHYRGHATPAFASLLAAKYGDRRQAGELARMKVEILRENIGSVPLLPRVEQTMEELVNRKIPFAIASNAPGAFVRRVVQEKMLPVEAILGREDVERGKPHPDIYLLAAKKIGLTMQDHPVTLVLEDSKHGLKAGIRAGMVAIGVTTQHNAKELLAAGAITTCSTIGEILDQLWIENPPT